jgi:hypothetical protein
MRRIFVGINWHKNIPSGLGILRGLAAVCLGGEAEAEECARDNYD